MSADSPAAVLVDASGNILGVVLDGAVYRLQTEAKLVAGTAIVGKVGIDPANTGGLALDATLVAIRDTAGIKKITDAVTVVQATYASLKAQVQLRNPGDTANMGDATNPVRTDPTGTTTQPISAASLPLPTGAATQTTLAALLTELQLKADLSETQPVSAASLPLPAGAATEATLATRASETKLEAVRVLLASLDGKDFSTQTTLAALLTAFNAEDFATQFTLSALLTAFNAEDFATQTTLATRLADATFTARVNVLGQNTMAASTPMVIASDQSAVASKNAAASQVDGHSVSIGATTDADTALTVIGRLKNLLSRIPAALVGGRFDQNIGSWFGSLVPTVGQKTMATSIPVTLPSDQTAVLVTFTGTRTGVVGSIISLGGGTAGTLQVMRATPYVEPTANAQRSFSSNNANDTAAGTGARTVHFTYYTTTGTGPFVEMLTLNGTTPVNTVATDIRFIEEMDIVTAGSAGANIGTITMHSTTGGGGTVVGTIGVGNILAGVGDQRTLWAHHYVEVGVTASLSTLIVGAQSGGSGTSARFFVKSSEVLTANAVELLVGDVLLVQGAFSRLFSFYVRVTGFVRLTAYAIPAVNNTVLSAAFDYSET